MSTIRLEVIPASGMAICGICNRVILHKPLGEKQVNCGIGLKYWSFHKECFRERHKVFLNELSNSLIS
jgi:hypothetical protein